MATTATLLSVLHWTVLTAFVGLTSVLMLVALLGRLCVRRPLLVWRRPGPLTRWPLGPSLFLGLVGAGIAWAIAAGRAVPTSVLLGYPAGGVFWLVATWLARTVLVTERGLVHDLTRPRRAIPWHSVVDYVATTRDGRPHFIFLYRRDGAIRRLDLPVPPAHADAMRDALGRTLDARYRDAAVRAPDEEVPTDPPDDPMGLS